MNFDDENSLDAQVHIYNILSEEVCFFDKIKLQTGSNYFTIDISMLKSGTYFIELFNEKKYFHNKLIKL